MNADDSSTGLATDVAAPLAYAGWWATGLLFWFLERRDPVVRFHAAQALAAFGVLALAIGGLGILALVSLSFFPIAFEPLIISAQVLAVLAVALWAVSLWQVASGRDWRLPLAARWAEWLTK